MLSALSFASPFESQNLASFIAQFLDLHFKPPVGLPLCYTPSYLDFKLQREEGEKRECHDGGCLEEKNIRLNSIKMKKKKKINGKNNNNKKRALPRLGHLFLSVYKLFTFKK